MPCLVLTNTTIIIVSVFPRVCTLIQGYVGENPLPFANSWQEQANNQHSMGQIQGVEQVPVANEQVSSAEF